MTINEASDFFKNFIIGTNEKSEKKVYEKFIEILSDLKNRDLTEKQLQSIEKKLDNLKLKANPEHRKKYFKQKLIEFTQFLKDVLSLITEGHYTGLGISLGMTFGMVFGMMFGMIFGVDSGTNGLIYGLVFGMIIGLIIGSNMDSNAKRQGKVLITKIH